MEEDTAEPKPQGLRHRCKRGLILALLLSVLLFSLFYYVVIPRVFVKALRRDSIPSDAYIIPWMRPNPPIEELEPQLPYSSPTFNIDIVMVDALKLNMIFRIDVPGGTRVMPSTVYLGHDADYLYIGGKITGMYSNPVSTPENARPNYLAIFFDVDNDGVLKQPESGSRLSSYIWDERVSFRAYHDMLWAYNEQRQREIWIMAGNYYDDIQRPQPPTALVDMESQYDNSTGTLIILFSRYLSRSSSVECNALQMRPGERWVMGFLLELGFATNLPQAETPDYVDGWPRNTRPYGDNNASWWPKLVIDLSNPPENM